jgi:FHA domain
VPALLITSGSQQGRRVEIVSALTIGRENQDLLLDDPEVSRSHAIVRVTGGALEIEDTGSSNGTWVNGRRITGPTRLIVGDEVVLGQTYIRAEGDRGKGTVVTGPAAGGTVVAPQEAPAPQQAAPAPASFQAPQGDPSHTAPMPTFSYDSGPLEQVEGPGRGRLLWVILGAVAVLAVIGGLIFFLLTRGPSKEDAIAEADAICAAATDEADAIEQPTDLAGSGPYFEGITRIQQDEVERLKALEVPDEDKDVFEDFIASQEALTGQFQDMAEAANAGDQAAFDVALAEATAEQSRATDLAEEYGFQNCGKSTPGE